MIKAIGTAPLHFALVTVSGRKKKKNWRPKNTRSRKISVKTKEGKIQDLLLSLLLVWNVGNGGFEIAQLLHQE